MARVPSGRAVALYVNPSDWLRFRFWRRVGMRLRYQVIVDSRTPPGRVYLGVPGQEPNGPYSKGTVRGKKRHD